MNKLSRITEIVDIIVFAAATLAITGKTGWWGMSYECRKSRNERYWSPCQNAPQLFDRRQWQSWCAGSCSHQKGVTRIFKAHLDKDLFIYVIRDGQNIVSCAFLLIVEKPMSPAFINGRTGMVLNVYTCPSYRRKGCAKKIMEALLAEAKKKKISVIELKATEDGYPLYRSVGF